MDKQHSNFFAIKDIFKTLALRTRLSELGVPSGLRHPMATLTITIPKTGDVHVLTAQQEDGGYGYTVKVNEYPLVTEEGLFLEDILERIVDQIESNSDQPVVYTVRDGDDTLELMSNGDMVIKCSRGKALVNMAKSHPDSCGKVLTGILDGIY